MTSFARLVTLSGVPTSALPILLGVNQCRLAAWLAGEVPAPPDVVEKLEHAAWRNARAA